MFLHIHIQLIQSVLLHANYLYDDYIYFKLHHYVCLLNSQFLLAALVHFLCILIGQFCFRLFVFIPVMEDWFVQLQQSGSHFWVLVSTFYMYRLQVNFVLCLEIHFLFLVLFQGLFMNRFSVKYIVLLCLLNQCVDLIRLTFSTYQQYQQWLLLEKRR